MGQSSFKVWAVHSICDGSRRFISSFLQVRSTCCIRSATSTCISCIQHILQCCGEIVQAICFSWWPSRRVCRFVRRHVSIQTLESVLSAQTTVTQALKCICTSQSGTIQACKRIRASQSGTVSGHGAGQGCKSPWSQACLGLNGTHESISSLGSCLGLLSLLFVGDAQQLSLFPKTVLFEEANNILCSKLHLLCRVWRRLSFFWTLQGL
mmetsp:Transcript_17472/g.31102  ORF Transcript_17472/g.31102 Transcript_17472/m.31102 type:complete len:209 (+) Transcript_17472:2458-3084(+)